MKRWLIGASIALFALAAQALPTVADVQAQVAKGNYAQAETMMKDVVAAKPGSARAHYIYAEILAHNARFAEASRETSLARELDPAFKFAKPEQFRDFEQLLERERQRSEQRARTPAPSSLDRLGPGTATLASPVPRPTQAVQAPAPQSGLPGWIWPVGLALVAFFAWKALRRPSGTMQPGAIGPGNVAPAAPAAYGPAPGFGPAGGGVQSPGGGLMGLGLAAAGGAAAGLLAERLLERGRDGRQDAGHAGDAANAAGLPGPSYADDAGRALESRDVDFGTGNDWESGGDVDNGGSSDTGGSSDGGW